MKKITLIVVASIAINSATNAGIGLVEVTGDFLSGTNGIFISSLGGATNPRWSGYSFGQFDLDANPTFNLRNFYMENYAFNGGLGNDHWLDNASTAVLDIYRNGALLQSLSMRQSNIAGNNRNWDLGATPAPVNLLAGLSGPGTHTLGFIVTWSYNEFLSGSTTVKTSQATPGGDATFSTIPEPSSASLLALGAAGLVALRRRRTA